MKIQNSWNSC